MRENGLKNGNETNRISVTELLDTGTTKYYPLRAAPGGNHIMYTAIWGR